MPKPRMIFAPGVRFKVVAGNPDFQDQVGTIIRVPSSQVFVAHVAPKPWVWDYDDGTRETQEHPEIEVVFGTCESEFIMIDQESKNEH